MKTIVDVMPYRTDVFEVVEEWPRGGYNVWNIGRGNFQHEGYIPLAQPTPENRFFVRLDTLKALYVGDEKLCLEVLRQASESWVNEAKYNTIKEQF